MKQDWIADGGELTDLLAALPPDLCPLGMEQASLDACNSQIPIVRKQIAMHIQWLKIAREGKVKTPPRQMDQNHYSEFAGHTNVGRHFQPELFTNHQGQDLPKFATQHVAVRNDLFDVRPQMSLNAQNSRTFDKQSDAYSQQELFSEHERELRNKQRVAQHTQRQQKAANTAGPSGIRRQGASFVHESKSSRSYQPLPRPESHHNQKKRHPHSGPRNKFGTARSVTSGSKLRPVQTDHLNTLNSKAKGSAYHIGARQNRGPAAFSPIDQNIPNDTGVARAGSNVGPRDGQLGAMPNVNPFTSAGNNITSRSRITPLGGFRQTFDNSSAGRSNGSSKGKEKAAGFNNIRLS